MDVEARIYLPEKPLENVWGYGEVTVEGLFTFQVRLLNYQKESGEETSFVSFPRRKVQGQWEDVVHPNLELRKKSEEVVNSKRNFERFRTTRNYSSEHDFISDEVGKKGDHCGNCNGRGVWSDNQRSHCETGTGWTFL